MKWDTFIGVSYFLLQNDIDDISMCRYNNGGKEVMLCYNLI